MKIYVQNETIFFQLKCITSSFPGNVTSTLVAPGSVIGLIINADPLKKDKNIKKKTVLEQNETSFLQTDHMLIIHPKQFSLSGKFDPQRYHWWSAGQLVLIEQSVPVVDESVPSVDGIAYNGCRRFVKQPWLASL